MQADAGAAALKADLNGDGIEDLVVAARCTNPLGDQAEDNFTVIDPYNQLLRVRKSQGHQPICLGGPCHPGPGAAGHPRRRCEAWRAAVPKAKFVIINLPFKQVTVKKLMVKKKPIMAIYAEETGGDRMTSATYWDGKRYRYQPIGSSMGD